MCRKRGKNGIWDSADLNRGPSVPNARGWTKLPYYPKGYVLSKEIILYIAFVRTWVSHAFYEILLKIKIILSV